MEKLLKTMRINQLTAYVFEDRSSMGTAAVNDITTTILSVLDEKEEVNILFAAAPSQNEILEGFRHSETIPWDKINAFHIDEYIGLEQNANQLFGNFLKNALFDHVPLKSINLIGTNYLSPEKRCKDYSLILKENPADIALLGIGENGHIAFNDPGEADFNDPETVKIVSLDIACREQQVHDGCFPALTQVPEKAITLTIPELIRAKYVYCIVPDIKKQEAVTTALNGKIDESCPASILRTINARIYLDSNSGACLL